MVDLAAEAWMGEVAVRPVKVPLLAAAVVTARLSSIVVNCLDQLNVDLRQMYYFLTLVPAFTVQT